MADLEIVARGVAWQDRRQALAQALRDLALHQQTGQHWVWFRAPAWREFERQLLVVLDITTFEQLSALLVAPTTDRPSKEPSGGPPSVAS